MTTLANLRYLKEVLGIEQVFLSNGASAQKLTPINSSATTDHTQQLQAKSIYVFADTLGTEEKFLLEKMLQAMKLVESSYHIQFNASRNDITKALETSPSLFLIFGEKVAEQLSISPVRGRFIDTHGVATIFTYSPKELLENPQLKAETWKDLKLAMRRLA